MIKFDQKVGYEPSYCTSPIYLDEEQESLSCVGLVSPTHVTAHVSQELGQVCLGKPAHGLADVGAVRAAHPDTPRLLVLLLLRLISLWFAIETLGRELLRHNGLQNFIHIECR